MENINISKIRVYRRWVGQPLDATDRWALLPVQNYAQSPQAGEQMETILATAVRSRGVNNLERYPALPTADDLPELDDRQRHARSLHWARQQGFRYAVTSSVKEWRYKSGIKGEPVVGVSMQVIEVPSGRVLWSASGARSGWGQESISGTAQKLLNELLATLDIATPHL